MNERLMQYCWEHRLWRPADRMVTAGGQEVEVIDTGLLNTDSGPDFFNAKVRVGDQVWAGNVELHVNASDWYRHHHDSDPAYESVILHVVLNDDGARVFRPDGREVPQVRMSVSDDFIHSYTQMVDNPFAALPCAGAIRHIPDIYITDWISSLGFERLHTKSERVLDLLARQNGDWMETVYITLARALGFGKNSDAFERLAAATPLRYLLKHRDSLTAVEAMLMGQAGFLHNLEDHPDEYVRTLCREYSFMAAKFGLKPIFAGSWKTSGMRPQGFPYRRVATLAMYVHEGIRLGSGLFEAEYADEAMDLLRVGLSPYWERHYTLGGPVQPVAQQSALSRRSLEVLTVNVAVPLIHARGLQLGDRRLQERAADMLCDLRAEQNSKVDAFTEAGIRCSDAFTSQALLQLRNAYCDSRKCLYCRIGHRLLAMSSRH